MLNSKPDGFVFREVGVFAPPFFDLGAFSRGHMRDMEMTNERKSRLLCARCTI